MKMRPATPALYQKVTELKKVRAVKHMATPEGSVGRHERDGAATTASSNDFDDNRYGFDDHGTTVALGPDQEGVTDSQAGAHEVGNSTDFGPPIGEAHDLTPSEMKEACKRIAQMEIIESARTNADWSREVAGETKDKSRKGKCRTCFCAALSQAD